LSLTLNLLSFCTPERVKKKEIYQLFKVTADAFNSKMPKFDLKKISSGKILQEYALFTKEKTDEFIKAYGIDSEKLTGLKNRLYKSSYEMGKEIKKNLKIKNSAEILKVMKLIYKIIKIDFKKYKNGVVIINSCFFSSYYNHDICCVISSLDKGLAAGISGGSNLEFFQRITDGKGCCSAHFDL
jgi:hypothetical protein